MSACWMLMTKYSTAATAVKRKLPGIPFAVEHQEEGKIDQRRARLLLENNENHGQEDKADSLGHTAILGHIEAVRADEFGQGQGGHAFGKLGRLQLDRAKTDPRERTLGVLGHKGRYQQYDHHKPVKDVGRNIKVALVEKQEENAQPEAQSDPHQLLAGARSHVEEVRVANFVTGTTDTEPPKGEQGYVEKDDDPINLKQGVRPLAVRHGGVIRNEEWNIKNEG